MTESPGFRVAGEDDLAAIGETLGLAFERDPVWGWGFEDPDPVARRHALTTVFGFWAEAALALGWVRVSDGVEAVALWIPPGEPEMSPEDEARFPGLVADACNPISARRIVDLMDAFDRNHPHGPPHFYLSLLGTHPDHAGRGIGMALLAACLEEIDAAGAPAFLESSNPANVPRYERAGFRPDREADLVEGYSVTQMWRNRPVGA